MSFVFQCPHCEHKLTVGDDWEGVETECPHCLATVKITRMPEPLSLPGMEMPAPRKSLARYWVYGVLLCLAVVVFGVNIYLAINSPEEEPAPAQEEAPAIASEPAAAEPLAPPPPEEAPLPAQSADAAENATASLQPPAVQLKSYGQLAQAVHEGNASADAIRPEDVQPFLMLACRKGDADVVEFLLEAKADPVAPGKDGLTPITQTVHSGHLDCLNLLLKKANYVDKPDQTGHVPLFYAVSSNKLDIAEFLCHKGADVNISQENNAWTPLLGAVKDKKTEMALLLIRHGAETDKDSADGVSPFELAITTGQLKVVEAICWRKKNLNVHLPNGSTPLLTAILSGNSQMVRLLLEFDANPNMPDASGKSFPITLAEKSNNIEMLEILMQKGALPPMKAQNNPSAAHERPKDIPADDVANEKEADNDEAPPNSFHVGDLFLGEKFRGNFKVISNIVNKNLPPPFELLQPQKKYGVFVIRPRSLMQQDKTDLFFPSFMERTITVFFSQLSLQNWGFIIDIKHSKPLDVQRQIWEFFANCEALGENQDSEQLRSSLSENDKGCLGTFIQDATQFKFRETNGITGGSWNKLQVYLNGDFLAVLYTLPFKRFSETLETSNRKCKLYILYVNIPLYQKACDELIWR